MNNTGLTCNIGSLFSSKLPFQETALVLLIRVTYRLQFVSLCLLLSEITSFQGGFKFEKEETLPKSGKYGGWGIIIVLVFAKSNDSVTVQVGVLLRLRN